MPKQKLKAAAFRIYADKTVETSHRGLDCFPADKGSGFFCYSLISPAHLKANLATITAMTSLMMAAATIVPDAMEASEASIAVKAETAIPVKIRDTP